MEFAWVLCSLGQFFLDLLSRLLDLPSNILFAAATAISALYAPTLIVNTLMVCILSNSSDLSTESFTVGNRITLHEIFDLLALFIIHANADLVMLYGSLGLSQTFRIAFRCELGPVLRFARIQTTEIHALTLWSVDSREMERQGYS